jgi:hypothetical protein
MTMTPQTPPPKRRGRPASSVTPDTPQKGMTYDKPPGHSHYQPNNFSLTISKLKGDVHPELLDLLHDYMTKTSIKSGLSTEVGHRAFNLHIQGTISDLTKFSNLSSRAWSEVYLDTVCF